MVVVVPLAASQTVRLCCSHRPLLLNLEAHRLLLLLLLPSAPPPGDKSPPLRSFTLPPKKSPVWLKRRHAELLWPLLHRCRLLPLPPPGAQRGSERGRGCGRESIRAESSRADILPRCCCSHLPNSTETQPRSCGSTGHAHIAQSLAGALAKGAVP